MTRDPAAFSLACSLARTCCLRGGETPGCDSGARGSGAGSKVCFRDTETPAGAALGGALCHPRPRRSPVIGRHTGAARGGGKRE